MFFILTQNIEIDDKAQTTKMYLHVHYVYDDAPFSAVKLVRCVLICSVKLENNPKTRIKWTTTTRKQKRLLFV